MISVSSILRNLPLLVLLVAASWLPVGAAGETLDDAVRLYDEGRYAEAKPLLERLVAAGDADGITHYRLFFCQRATSDPAQQQTLELARALLEKEVAVAKGFEAAFYLSNTYANLGLSEEVQRLATEVLARFDAKDLKPPTSAVEQFRLAKLYSDQQRDREAVTWFEKAVDGFEAGGETAFQPYLEWGARWLGNRAMNEERFEEATRQFGRLGAAATVDDFDKLGLANLMVGDYRASTKAWQRAVVLNPANANRYRYGSALAELARQSGEIPISPDGDRGWDELSDEELNQMLNDNVAVVREVKAEAEAIDALTPEQRKTFNDRIKTIRPLFIGAALETVRRGVNLREAAFFGGYAPLIFHAREWQVKPAAPQYRPGARGAKKN